MTRFDPCRKRVCFRRLDRWKLKRATPHITGRHFRDYHLLLDEQAAQIFAMTDDIAERARKIGGNTLHSISDISKHQRLKDDNQESIRPEEMLAELRADNRELTRFLHLTHEVCERHKDVATASLVENWIDRQSGGHGFCQKQYGIFNRAISFQKMRQ